MIFLLFQAATRGCALSSEQFSQVIPPTALFAAIRSFGCFYEYGKMDRLADSKVNVKFSLKQLDSNEKILQMDELSISIRRVLLAISPLWRVVRGKISILLSRVNLGVKEKFLMIIKLYLI